MCLDKIHEVAKTKVSKPKRFIKVKTLPCPPKMSTSRCGDIVITPPKCLCKERGSDFYSRCSIVAASTLCHGDAVFRL